MVFSLFGRKDKSSSRKSSASPVRGQDSALRESVPCAPSTEVQRELARQTAEKIDRIESEMIAAALPVPPAPKRVQKRTETLQASSGAADPMALPLLVEPSNVISVAPASAEVRVADGHLAPELEEAAILFANGQGEAAAATLANVLTDDNELVGSAQGWMMLLDVYQAHRYQEAFESAAIQYAARFEQSPPTWRPAAVSEAISNPAPTTRGGLAIMVPTQLDESFGKSSEMAMRAQRGKRPVSIDLNAIEQVDAAGVALLLDLIRQFKADGGALVLLGAPAMFEVIKPLVEPGRRDDGEDIWMLALELLRVQGLRAQFDDLSIDYCVTFEVSPPPWEPMPDSVRDAKPREAELASDVDDAASSQVAVADVSPRFFRLAGEVAGRMQKELEGLRSYAESRSQVVIDCRDLIRLDFVAAGEMLNEVASLGSGGKTVVFTDVSAIVAALLSVMGIHELAEIRRRKI